MKKIYLNEVKKAFVDTVPVMAGYLVLGAGFGIILKSKGYGLLYAVLMSLFIYAGSMQFVAVDLLSAGTSYITIALTTLLVNARHLFYGISMVDKYRNLGKVKPYVIFALTDETYSLVCNTDIHENLNNYYFLISVFNHFYWILGTVIGSIVGSLININTKGLDFALTALFFTVFIEQWKQNDDHFPAAIGVISTLICLLLFGANSFLIPSMISIVILIAANQKTQEMVDKK